tara:strand:+ start:1597 stop:2169 length:573 start_codon:yes stop_codon:yes gene_type:complete
MANYEATRYDFDGANLSGIEGIPTATIIPWSDSSVPTGFLECNGAAVSRSTYSALFAIIGTTYGAGNGSTTFDLPDLQDNVPVGKSNNKAVGSTGGANTVAKTGNVAGSTANATLSTAQLASHTHPSGLTTSPNPDGGTRVGGLLQGKNIVNTGSTGSGDGHAHNMSANFTGDATSVLQPYLTIIYIIKT